MKELATIDWADAFSRLHPVLLHLPIGLFVTLIWLQLISVFKGLRAGARGARTGLVSLLMISTPAAAISGWLLNEGSKYPDPVDLHKWLGVGLAVFSLVLGWAHFRGSKAYTPLLWLGVVLVMATAHNGGTLTHGEGFLTDPWIEQEKPKQPKAPVAASTQAKDAGQGLPAATLTELATNDSPAAPQAPAAAVAAVPYEEVHSVMEDLCFRCHGERKQRGGLALHTVDAMLAGGDSGPALVFGDPDASLFLKLMRLPADHDDHMPPVKKTQPEPEEIALLERWVQTSSGQESFPSLVSEQPQAPEFAVEPGEDSFESEPAEPEEQEPAVPAQEEPAESPAGDETGTYFSSLVARQAHVQRVAPNSDSLWIDFSSSSLKPGELPGLLAPVSERVVELGLSRKALNEADLRFLGSLPALAKLDLRRTTLEASSGTGLDLTHLANSKSLRTLNLAGTALAPGSLDAIAKIENLQTVSLAGTGLESELPTLRERRPSLQINLGSVPREALEVEPEVKFERVSESE